MSVSSVTVPSFSENRGTGKRLRRAGRRTGPFLDPRAAIVRKTLYLCMLLAACGGTPSDPSASPASNPGSPIPSPGNDARVQLTDDLGGRQLFPADNWWNQDMSTAPVDPQSDAFISFIGRTRGAHPDFGAPPYGIPYVGVSGSQPRVAVAFVDYGSESDAGFRGEAGHPIPDAARP